MEYVDLCKLCIYRYDESNETPCKYCWFGYEFICKKRLNNVTFKHKNNKSEKKI